MEQNALRLLGAIGHSPHHSVVQRLSALRRSDDRDVWIDDHCWKSFPRKRLEIFDANRRPQSSLLE
jgi:hypothetical protein